jgi:hypothetical protein
MVNNSIYNWCFVNKTLTRVIVFVLAMCVEAMAQTPTVFNFENATKVSELPEQLAVANTSAPSMQKRYYLDPNSRLFDAPELKAAYQQLNSLRSVYAKKYGAEALWLKTCDLLFSDKFIYAGKCESLSEGVLKEREADINVDYTRKLQEVLGREHYTELKFCLEYLGINYSDWELWQAYVEDRKNLIEETKTLPQLSNRLKAFVLAVDIRYTLCMPNDAVSGFLPLKTDVNTK